MMDINDMIKKIKAHPDAAKIGMIASHLGIVRGHSRTGGDVDRVEVTYDHNIILNIVNDIKMIKGIVEVLIYTNEGQLKVGDEILAVAVGGDIRETVFPALVDAVGRIKKEATRKKEFAK